MTGQPTHSDRQWLEAMFADLQRQVDDLSCQLQALDHVVQLALVDERRTTPPSAQPRPQERRDG